MFTLIGSAPSARIYLPSKSVSRCHAVIINTGGTAFVRDLASRTHVRVNGRVVEEADLREGDVIEIGRFSFKFTDPAPGDPAQPAAAAPQAVLEVEGLDEPLPIKARTVLNGRRETADISLTENAASSAHALLFVSEGKHLLRDLKSRTGLYVNGVKADEHALSPGDVFRVGETTFRYVVTGGAAAPAVPEPAADDEAPSPIPETIPDPEPHAVAQAPAEPSRPSDFDFIPLELAPEDASPSPAVAEPSPAPDGGTAVGLLELAEPPAQESSAGQRNGDEAPSPAAPPPEPIRRKPASEPPKPVRWSAAAASRPAVPAPPADRPTRPRSPLDLLGEAGDLEPLPEPPADDASPDALSNDQP
jgi:pSer/pThr/pTyr-binding forkhead associated (FHA) protein